MRKETSIPQKIYSDSLRTTFPNECTYFRIRQMSLPEENKAIPKNIEKIMLMFTKENDLLELYFYNIDIALRMLLCTP